MATVKGYTDLEQSRKLAEILPLESADMIHIYNITCGKENGFLDVVPKESILYAMHTTIEEKEKSIPCWSLMTLLEVLKNKIVYGGNDSKNWFVSYTKKNPTKTIFIYKEHLIDACYEAILNLNKEGLL